MSAMKLLFAVTLMLFVPIALNAQDEIPTAVTVQNRSGDLPFSSSVGTDVEHVDVVSGNLTVNIPISHVPGRGMDYTVSLHYDARWLMAAQRGSFKVWNAERRLYVPDNGFGWQTNQPYVTYFDSDDHLASGASCPTDLGQPHPPKIKTVNGFIFSDASLSKHPLIINREDGTACGSNGGYLVNNTAGPDSGGAGIWAVGTTTLSTAPDIYLSDGTNLQGGGCDISTLDGRICPYGLVQDVHGNVSGFGPGATDSVGRVNVTQTNGTNSVSYAVYDADGNPQTYTVNYSSFPISTTFGVNDLGMHPITEFVQTRNAINSIVLPDGSSYQFVYDNFGELTQLTLPTGGAITYTWNTFSDHESSYRYVTSRTFNQVNPVTGANIVSQWVFARPSASEVIVTDPAGNQTDYTLSNSSIHEAKIYTGSIGGTPTRDYVINYMVSVNSNEDEGPLSITTTLENGLVSRKEFDYDSFSFPQITCNDQVTCITNGSADPPSQFTESRANVKAMREYDFGTGMAGSLLRVTTNHYLHEPADNPSTASQYAAKNIVGKIIQQTVTSTTGGVPAADTKYEYDNLTTSGPFLGDATAVKHWRNTDGAWLATAYTYNPYGSITSMTDPKSHATNWGYNDLFSSSSSHCLPSGTNVNSLYVSLMTNAKGQQTQLTHSPCTGQVKQHKNQNDITAVGPGMVYDFDLLNRPLSVVDPSGGSTHYSYPDAKTVVQSQAITSAMSDVHTTKRDAFGRPTQTQHTMPSGPPATVDTGYDNMGRAANVTNPYFTTGDPTYGKTTTFYDDLSRVSQVQKQDGSVAANSFTGNCTTATDEAGRPRRSCTDALGRLIEVDEPDAGFIGAPAQGRIDIGAIKTIQAGAHPAFQATGSVTITGTEKSKIVNTTYCAQLGTHGQCLDWETDSTTIFDAGTVQVTANGHLDQTTYGQGDDVGTIANRLAGVVRTNSPYIDYSSVSVNLSANPPTATINLISKSSGSTTNYTLSIATTFDTVDFTSGSFTETSSAALSGGTDAFAGIPTADYGTLTISAGSFTTPSIPYGAGTANPTASSVASALATALNASGSGVNASTNGGTGLIITATAAGVSGNSISVNTHPTSGDPTDFPSPSFAVSSVTLGGGLDPDPLGTSLPLITLYQYDVLGNLLCVEQHGGVAGTGCGDSPSLDANSPWRVRRFTYDSLSHLTSSSNPEANSYWNGSSYVRVPTTYKYDDDGNLWQKTSPAPNQMGTLTQTITYCYEELHRVTGKAYSAQICVNGLLPTGTAVASYFYDQASYNGLTISNPIGHRTGMADQAGFEAWSYDAMGRPLFDKRTTAGVTKTTGYLYDLMGNVTGLTYPSNTTIGYSYNSANQAVSAIDSTNSINYATLGVYSATGALQSLTNGANINSAYYDNQRLQPCRISVSAGGATPLACADSPIGNIMDFTYNFGATGANNGNVVSIANNRDTTRSQSFTYDSLNRINTAQTSATTGAQCWGETFGYDGWGNLLALGGITSQYSSCTQESGFGAGASSQNQISTNLYDAAGNMTTGGYTYDAENRLSIAGGVTYTYDGDGKRVEKSSGKIYWYGMGSDVLDETDLTGSTINSAFNEYAFFTGKRIARRNSSNTVFYYFADHLGTSRVMIQGGQTTSCYDADFYPFGGERTPIVNTCPQNFKFTGKERDSESGLDDFGARYDASNIGRFTSPDSFWKDSHPEDPQSWNKYAYARNNPLKYVDPNGEAASVSTQCTTGSNGVQSCNVTVTATITIYAAPGNNFTSKQMQDFAKEMQKGINSAWSGSTTVDNINVNVQTNVTVNVADSKDAAMKSGADNVIGLTAGMVKPGDYVSATNPHGLFAGPGSPDSGVWSTTDGGGLAAQSAHEFGHLLGALESSNTKDLMSSGIEQLISSDHVHATQNDFNHTIGIGVHAAQINSLLGQFGSQGRLTAPTTPEININTIWRALTH